MRTLSRIFKALSDGTRLQMLGLLLKKGELCVCDFVGALGITQSKASRHLRNLVHAGLVNDRRQGTWIYFRLAERPGSAQNQVLRALPAMLRGHLPRELFERLDDWLGTRKCTAKSCCRRAVKRAGGRK